VHKYLKSDPVRCLYYTTTIQLPSVFQQNCTVRQRNTQKNSAKYTSTWTVIQPVAVILLLTYNCLLNHNTTAMSAQTPHWRTPLCAPVSELLYSPLQFLYNYQRTDRFFSTEMHLRPLSSKMNIVSCTCTLPLIQSDADILQLPSNFTQHLNKTALSSHSLRRRSHLRAPIPEV